MQSITKKRTRPLRILRARAMGMCFGVRDAIEVTRCEPAPESVTVRGELVHNEQVQDELAERGFKVQPESETSAVPDTVRVLVTAHGISAKDRSRLERAGKQIIDTTCPLVRVVHQAARELANAGRFVVVLGKQHHVEVRGITGDLERFAVVERVSDVRCWHEDRIGVVCQSTSPPDGAQELLRAIERVNAGADVRFVDTICHPTRARQEAIDELLERVEAVVVVGGHNSNNTRKLVGKARDAGLPTIHVQDASGICAAWLAPFDTVGLTAGTSTPPETIEAVHQRLVELGVARG